MIQTGSIRNTLISIIVSAIQQVAPEIEESEIDFDVDLREQCDIDSMDYLNFLTALKKSTGINIPENDYQLVATVNTLLDYLAQRS